MEAILIGPEQAALERIVATGKVEVPSQRGALDYDENGTAILRKTEVDASDFQIEQAKRRLAREELRRKRVEAERKERERLLQRAEAQVPEVKALRDAEEKLANARAELTTLTASEPSIAQARAGGPSVELTRFRGQLGAWGFEL